MATESKKWYGSKTIWSGVIAILIAAYNAACGHWNLPAIPEIVYGVLGAIGVYGRATATTTIK